MFNRLTYVTRVTELINILLEVAEHLCKLQEQLNHYFPEHIVINENLKISEKHNQCKLRLQPVDF